MEDAARLAFQIMVAGNTLAGLTLVFLGNIANSYQGYETDAQNSVRLSHQIKAWVAFSSLVSSIFAGVCGLLFSFYSHDDVIYFGLFLLAIAVAGVIFLGFVTSFSIK